MTSSLVETWTSPVDFVQVFGDPPLATTERREDYNKLADAVTRAAKPADAIAALFVRDIIDITWEIQRERRLKLHLVKSAEKAEVARMLDGIVLQSGPFGRTPSPSAEARNLAKQWERDVNKRSEVQEELVGEGHDLQDVLPAALVQARFLINICDTRIASFELRRLAVLRACEQYNEKFSRRLAEASSLQTIEGEFTEA